MIKCGCCGREYEQKGPVLVSAHGIEASRILKDWDDPEWGWVAVDIHLCWNCHTPLGVGVENGAACSGFEIEYRGAED